MTYITDIEQIGIEKGQETLIRNMHKHGMSVEEIAKVTGLDKAKVLSLLSGDSD